MLGPSGSGKTTTLRLIAGFELPTEGRVWLHGVDVTPKPPFERDVNTVFQDYALFPHMTVGDNVAYGLTVRKVPKADAERRVGEALAMVRLTGYERRKPAQLSGGQRQRVALARALVNRPRVLLLDEPLGALDLKLREEMQLELKAIQREVGITFIYVTHDQEEALTMSDRLAVFNRGRIEQLGTPADLYERPATAFVAGFVGTSNLLRGERREGARREDGLFTVRPEKIRIAEPVRAAINPFGEHIPGSLGPCAHTRAPPSSGIQASSAPSSVRSGRSWAGFSSRRPTAPGRARARLPAAPRCLGPGLRDRGRRGAAAEALARPGVARVYAHSLLDNPASIRVMREDRHDLRGPVGLQGAAGRRVRGAGTVRRRAGPERPRAAPLGGPDRSWRPSQAASAREGMRAAVPRKRPMGRDAAVGPRGDRPGTPGPHRCAQGRAVRVGRGDVDGTVRARARGGRIRAAGPEVAGGGAALERGEGDGQVDGAPDGRAPRGRGRPGVRGRGEHVFVNLGRASDGSGVLQANLQRPLRGLHWCPARTRRRSSCARARRPRW